MVTPAELREQARSYQKAAETAESPDNKRLLASKAFAKAQEAEKLERAEQEKVEWLFWKRTPR